MTQTAFIRYRHNLKTVGNLTVKTRCRTLMLKKSTYNLRIDQSRSKSVEKCAIYITVECSLDAVSNLYRLGFRFQNLPFSKSAGIKVPFSCEREAYPSHFFTVFKMCRHRVNAVSHRTIKKMQFLMGASYPLYIYYHGIEILYICWKI